MFFLVYIRNIYIYLVSPAIPYCLCLCYSRVEAIVSVVDVKAKEHDHEMMRIARYCTSVLISGRTIPVDVLLFIFLCDFTYRPT